MCVHILGFFNDKYLVKLRLVRIVLHSCTTDFSTLPSLVIPVLMVFALQKRAIQIQKDNALVLLSYMFTQLPWMGLVIVVSPNDSFEGWKYGN